MYIMSTCTVYMYICVHHVRTCTCTHTMYICSYIYMYIHGFSMYTDLEKCTCTCTDSKIQIHVQVYMCRTTTYSGDLENIILSREQSLSSGDKKEGVWFIRVFTTPKTSLSIEQQH